MNLPSRAAQFESVVADALAGTLEHHDFNRAGDNGFKRPFPGGLLAVKVRAEELEHSRELKDFDTPQVGIVVAVEVTWYLTKQLLAAMPDLKSAYLPGAPSMVSPLQMLAASSPGTDALFVDYGPAAFTLIINSRADVALLVRQHVIPMLAAVTDDAAPWFQNPRTVLDMQLGFYMSHEQAPAGFEFVCMEDLILARLCGSPLLEKLAKKRFEVEQRLAAVAPQMRRWSNAEALRRVFSHTSEHIRPNAWLSRLPNGLPPVADKKALEQLQVSRRVVVAALALNAVTIVLVMLASFQAWPAPVVAAGVVGVLLASAWAIWQAGGLLFGGQALRSGLPLSVLLPPVHTGVLAFLVWRMAQITAGLRALQQAQ
jgi:hypothetical protein